MQYQKRLIESYPMLERIPDQSLIVGQYDGENHIQVCRGESYAFVYIPYGLPVEIQMGKIGGEKIESFWYNPRSGEYIEIAEYANKGQVKFHPPTHGRNNDWILILEGTK